MAGNVLSVGPCLGIFERLDLVVDPDDVGGEREVADAAASAVDAEGVGKRNGCGGGDKEGECGVKMHGCCGDCGELGLWYAGLWSRFNRCSAVIM